MARILIVDDDADFRRMLCTMLEQAGHEVRAAADGSIAVALELQCASELILLDLVMPEKEGLETIRELRKLNAGAKIIAMSGGGRSNPAVNLTVATRLGAKRALKKPFSRSDLLVAIDELLAEPGS